MCVVPCVCVCVCVCVVATVNKAVEEFWDSDCKQDEIIHSFKLIREAGGDMSNLLPLVLTAALERRGVDFAKRLLPFEEVFNTALTKEAGEGGVTAQEMQAGALAIMRDLHNLCEDQPKVRLANASSHTRPCCFG